MDELLLAGGMLLGGGLLGYAIRAVIFIVRKNNLELFISQKLMQARESAQQIIADAHEKAVFIEDRLLKKEEVLDARQLEIDSRSAHIEQKTAALTRREAELAHRAQVHEQLVEERAGYTTEQARDALMRIAEEQYREDIAAQMHKLDRDGHEVLSARAKTILTTAIQRLASATTTELAATTVEIESDEIKGKIIGKEGRNIRAFERFAGVELLVDETPGALVVSSFDPVRRAIAVLALEALIKDGRIQPARIEEELEKAKAAIHDLIKQKGADAVYECGIYNFDPRLIAILGRLHFRTSYGQNVLQHSIEMAHLAEMLASEVGADPYIAKAGALVHDIGKALDHEFEGTHIDIGIKVLRRFGTDERIITAMKSHHDDCPHESLEAVIVQTADSISGSRPGARRDTADRYLKRLADLEGLANKFEGVEKAYALQAGREIRVFVHPESVSDFEAKNLARTIAISIETELRYPGQIKVTMIRETRVIDYAR